MANILLGRIILVSTPRFVRIINSEKIKSKTAKLYNVQKAEAHSVL